MIDIVSVETTKDSRGFPSGTGKRWNNQQYDSAIEKNP